MKIAVVGTGISGLVCAYSLYREHEITVFEADERIGGHSNTIDLHLKDGDVGVDTGFIVYNERNYPGFTRLLRELDVATHASDMCFSVSHRRSGFEYRATNLNTLYAQRSNLLRPSFHKMLVEIVRFNRSARQLLERSDDETTLSDLLEKGRFSKRLVEDFVVPMGASIWSADPETFTSFPAHTYARFMANHGLLSFGDQPQWRTVTGGSQRYVSAMARPFRHQIRTSTPVTKIVRRHDPGRTGPVVEVHTASREPELFDAVILATHSDQALGMLGDPSAGEYEVLSSLGYQPNTAVLHRDPSLMPRRRRTWASWNYNLVDGPTHQATLTYHMNRLQALETVEELFVTLNNEQGIDPEKIIARFSYSHPVFNSSAIKAQKRRSEIQGKRNTYFCGAYWGYGFHEDGVQSALDVCRDLGSVTRSSSKGTASSYDLQPSSPTSLGGSQ